MHADAINVRRGHGRDAGAARPRSTSSSRQARPHAPARAALGSAREPAPPAPSLARRVSRREITLEKPALAVARGLARLAGAAGLARADLHPRDARATGRGLSLVALVTLGSALLASSSACTVDPDNLPPDLTFAIAVDKVWPAPSTTPPPAAGETRVLLTNNLDDTVSIVDLAPALAGESGLIGSVPVGFVPVEREGPHHIVADAAGQFYYLGISNFVPGSGSGPHGVHGSGTAEGHVIKMRVDDNSVVATVRIDRNPGDVRLTPNGALLLASHFDLLRIQEADAEGIVSGPALDSRLAIIDALSMERIALVDACPAAHGIGITADSSTAVLSCVSDEVAVVDLASHAVTRVPVLDEPGTALAPACFPYAITMDSASSREIAWVSCFNTGEVVAVDVAARSRVPGLTRQLQGNAVFGDVRNGVIAFAQQSLIGVDAVTFLDAADGAFLSTKQTTPDECVLPHATRFVDDARVLVVCEGDKATPGTLLVIDAAPPHATVSVTPLGLFPDDIALVRRAP